MKDMHEVVDRCQQIIISSLRTASPECVVLFSKDRIDETNLPHVIPLAHKLLDVEEAAKVERALNFLRKALDEICKEYYDWALQTGAMYGKMYKVPYIDSNSLALEGLYKAIIRFRPRGSFKSYAMSWIRQVIQRSADQHICYTLDDNLAIDKDLTALGNLQASDTLWGQSSFYGRDPFFLDELRETYCSHLSMDEMKDILKNQELAEKYDC